MTSIKALPEYIPNVKPKKLSRRAREWMRNHLLPPYTTSVPDTVFGITFGDSPHYDKPWFRKTVGRMHRMQEAVDDVYYWFSHRFMKIGRRHVVHTGMKPGWHDCDEMMFCACFAILGRYVEEELGKLDEDDSEDGGYSGYRLHCEGGSDEAAIDLWIWYKHIFRFLRRKKPLTLAVFPN